ncbi:MAG: hypothetical protein GTN62_07800 [Gemmatimonadales bacterium]|nr:hypothetical protein [Gemmatimonadales bacterium]NIN50003.1 hypothetical protein [Gemmatimonadales bacterium]NIP07467.1 hypothetical protein [Gemmatimonadales bacterium]NIR03106.1 hypothetical protein [Gemmatimonadales bacterium]NIS66818.1 hypothetical protein [Gemmatimonadales bacterium]
MLWLLFVLAVLAWVVARQTSAVVTAGEVEQLRNRRSYLEAERAELLRRIRKAASRAVLVPRAESLGLRLPVDSEIVILQAPAKEGR